MQHIIVLLSRHVDECNKIEKLLHERPIPHMSVLHVDHPDARACVTNLGVTEVPCVLFCSEDGVEKFTQPNLYDWFLQQTKEEEEPQPTPVVVAAKPTAPESTISLAQQLQEQRASFFEK